jgi:hypothetical protein
MTCSSAFPTSQNFSISRAAGFSGGWINVLSKRVDVPQIGIEPTLHLRKGGRGMTAKSATVADLIDGDFAA